MSNDQKAWDEVYEENKYVILSLVISSDKKVTLKVKSKVAADAWFWAAKKGRKYTLDFGLGDEEYEEGDVPRPIRKLIATRGGGPNGNAVKMPEPKLFVKGYPKRPYVEYFTQWQLRGGKPEEYFPQDLHAGYAYIYLQAMGVPAYL